MKGKTPESMAKEELSVIERLKTASECSIGCENRRIKDIISLPPSFESTSMSALNYMMGASVSVCKGGYEGNIQNCPKYQSEISNHKETVKALLEQV